MARKEKTYRRVKAAKRVGRTNIRNLAMTKKGRPGIML